MSSCSVPLLSQMMLHVHEKVPSRLLYGILLCTIHSNIEIDDYWYVTYNRRDIVFNYGPSIMTHFGGPISQTRHCGPLKSRNGTSRSRKQQQ